LYDELYEAWRKERENKEVQILPRDFYARLAEYVKKLKEESRMLDEKTLRGKLLQGQKENTRRLAEELIRTRCGKIMRGISDGKILPVASLTEEEANMYEKVSPTTESYLSLQNNILQGYLAKAEEKTMPKTILVRILQEIPAIIGADMKTYGPFKPEDVAAIPAENARILIKQDAAEEIEIK